MQSTICRSGVPRDGGLTEGCGTGLPAYADDDAKLVAWIERVGARDERALEALYDATLSRVYGIVLRIVRRRALAEEVVEDTYFQVWRQALRFDPARGRALAWLLGMARSRSIDALRREARHACESLDSEEGPAVEEVSQIIAEDLLACTRTQSQLHLALRRIGGESRQLVALAFFRGLTHEEIAKYTELPIGTVKTRIRRALLTLRDVLDQAARREQPDPRPR
jgi:RNA polymerase sigma factor (sigma-70 family)